MKRPEFMGNYVVWAIVLMVVLGFWPTSSHAASIAQTINPDGRTELTLTKSNDDVVRIAISQIKLGDSFPYKDALLWGGEVGQPPQAVLSSIQIKEKDKTIFVSLSAYADLGDVKVASLKPTTHGFELALHGGNTATSYDAMLVFSRGYLVSRTVRLVEFPDEALEKTTYSFPKE
jgi:hypothetical protein